MIRRLGATAGIAALLGLAAAPASAYDLRVTDVEVNQAVQTDTNSIELVANRSTAVRATVSTTGTTGGTPGPVSGRLHVFRNGIELTPAAGVPAINQPFTPPASPIRANENDTLNFELQAPTGIGASSNLDFRVDLDPQANEENVANNSGLAENLTARERTFPRVFFIRVNYAGSGLPDLPLIRPGTGDAFICGILPVDDSQSEFYRRAPLPSMTFDEDSDDDGVMDALSTDGNNLLAELAEQRQLIVDDGLGANDLTHLFGWLNGSVEGNGLGEVPGKHGFGNTDPVRAQRSFAHELTHNFGLNHINRTLDPLVGWDFDASLDQNPATNNTTGRVKPQDRFDVQVAGRLTNTAWIDQQNYQFLLDHEEFAPVPTRLTDLRRLARAGAFHIVGRVNASGDKLQALRAGFRYPWKSQATPPSRGEANLDVIVRTTSGKTYRVPASATVGDDEEPGVHTRQGFFEATVPVPAGATVADVRVVSRGTITKSGLRKAAIRTIGIRKRSIRRPSVRDLRAIGGKTLKGRETIDWRALDADTRAKNLTYQAAYSPDNGRSFVPLDVNLKSSRLTFDADELPPSEGDSGLIRIFVSDGINSSYRDLRGISITSILPFVPTACQEP